MSIVSDVHVIYGVVEADQHEVWQRDLLHTEYVDVDGTLVFAGALAIPLTPV